MTPTKAASIDADTVVGPPATPDASAVNLSNRTSSGVHLIALVALTGVLIALCAALAVPVTPAITWSVALAILAWPMHHAISRYVTWPGFAAGLSTTLVAALILGTGAFVTYQLARETASAIKRMNNPKSDSELKQSTAKVPVVGRVTEWMEKRGYDLEEEIRKGLVAHLEDVRSFAQGSLTAMVQFLVMVFILYHLFRNHGRFLNGLKESLPLSKEESELVVNRAGDSIYANLYATVVTSLIDTVGFGLLFWGFGLPAPLLWATVMFVLSLVPVLGAGLVWVPTVVYLGLSSQWLAMAAILAWGAFTFVLVDNALYARLVGNRTQMNDALALIAFLGGLAIFGMSGIILGPVIFAVTFAIIEVWKKRLQPIH